MEQIEKIIRAICNVYDIDRNLIIAEKFGNQKRRGHIKALCYFCYDAILRGKTNASIRDIRRTLEIEVDVILNAYESVKSIKQNHFNGYWEIIAIERLIYGEELKPIEHAKD